jgi:hypothetical protein
VKAISLWEPWGTAIAKRLKAIETRHWATPHRGLLAIHCAKTHDHADFIRAPEVSHYFARAGVTSDADLSFGCIVAVVELVDCIPTTDLLIAGLVGHMEHSLGDYSPDRFGWLLRPVVTLAEPIPICGRQALFNVPDSLFAGTGALV